MIPASHIQEFLRNNPLLVVGEQKRTDHLLCPAGMDTRGRLYVKRTEKGILFYCHNCSDWGAVWNTKASPDFAPISILRELSKEENHKEKLELVVSEIKQRIKNSQDYPKEALDWFRKYNCCDPGFLEASEFFWDEDYNRVALLCRGLQSEYLGVQLRNVGFNPDGPKYITLVNSCIEGPIYNAASLQINNKIIIFCEDVLSSAKLAYVTSFSVTPIALLGTNVSKIGHILPMIPTDSKIIIWMDHDIPGRRAALKISSLLGQAGFDCKTIYPMSRTEVSPKEILDSEELVNWVEKSIGGGLKIGTTRELSNQ